MKNIYITDLDHTFLRTDLSVSDYTKKIWNSYEQDSIISIATARTYKKTMQFLQGVSINAPMILLDGALIATVDKKIVDTKFVSKEMADVIIDEGAKLGIYPFVLSLLDQELNESFTYSFTLNSYQTEILKRYANDDHTQGYKNLRAMEDNFKIVYMDDEEILIELKNRIEKVFGDELKYILAPEAYMGCYFLTILHKDADKAHGIESVSEAAGFDLSRLSVFGDNLNDIGMFDLAKVSIAVANAHNDVKKMANVVLPHTNDEDAVAKYLEGLRDG
ncbi:HAD-IIB family hydrolase [Sulfurimonas sp. C5]|uniref:HAD-IIB family hydrolase n=1 Tax=Sulfurimonas sp. C5 TaxID=3036947 RepID=UPI002455A939|nr:HAD-IIB family hydrolase [Sulfurimonas sp. C5]MDH4944747.1 HAD-IIB family hydrolase [Sulfurimonas sp. C5]